MSNLLNIELTPAEALLVLRLARQEKKRLSAETRPAQGRRDVREIHLKSCERIIGILGPLLKKP